MNIYSPSLAVSSILLISCAILLPGIISTVLRGTKPSIKIIILLIVFACCMSLLSLFVKSFDDYSGMMFQQRFGWPHNFYTLSWDLDRTSVYFSTAYPLYFLVNVIFYSSILFSLSNLANYLLRFVKPELAKK